jgi:SAM-dependent methyltransferase
MILPQLVWHHLRHRDDARFYEIQAAAAIRWLNGCGIELRHGMEALDLGCGHGVFGRELLRRGVSVTFADERNCLLPELDGSRFLRVNLDRDSVGGLGRFDLVICSNVLEHLRQRERFMLSIHELLNPNGTFYLSWTNWLSPWGGHEFSPFHYLGPKWGPLVFDRLTKRRRIHTPFENLFPTSIGTVLRQLRRNGSLRVLRVAPRYYPEFDFLVRIPGLREIVAWNCAILLARSGPGDRLAASPVPSP